MASVKPRLVVNHSTPSLFLNVNATSAEPAPLILQETIQSKSSVYLSLFSCLPNDFPLHIPETLIKESRSKDPVFISISHICKVVCSDSHAVDCFFRSAFSVHMMRTLSRPSPFLVPKFVVQCAAGLLFCRDQAEALRVIEDADWYLVQTFVVAREQRAQKYRISWKSKEHHSVKAISKGRLFPYNTPALKTATAHFTTPQRRRKHVTSPSRTATPASNMKRKHRLSELEFSHSQTHIQMAVSPYSVSFLTPEECIVTEVHRQEVDDQANQVLRYLRGWVGERDEVLQGCEFDLVQGASQWYFLNLKSFTTAKKEDMQRLKAKRPRLLHALTRSRTRSHFDESLEGLKNYFDRPEKPFVTRSKYIDLGEVQDKNIQLYQMIKDSLAV